MPPYFVTTPIFYVNDVPHLGHAYTVVAADAVARYRRLCGDDVRFLTGTDEHGQKIEKAAAAQGETPQVMTDRLSARYRTLWDRLNISYDDFVRTTEPRHQQAVHALFNRLRDVGDIYLDAYAGLYCVPCESFWTELQSPEGMCPDCGRPVETVRESSYFFRLSGFGERLLAHIEAQPDFILPASRRNETIQFIKSGLRDLSVSRTGVRWGVPVPDDPDHVIYVWLDALANYLTGCGYPDALSAQWPAHAHIIGKDILRFHATYWPAFLLSAGMPLPRHIVTHGWWTIDGEKMSKSRGNVVDPGQVADHFGVDVLRYFLLREVPFGQDGNFSLDALVGRANTDLANDLGNLLSRTVAMVHKYRGGVIPAPGNAIHPDDTGMVEALTALPERVAAAMDRFALDQALVAIGEVVSEANRYVDRSAPWTLAKTGPQTDDAARLDTVLYTALDTLRGVAYFLSPFMPDCARRMWTQLGITDDPGTVPLAELSMVRGLASGTPVPVATPLFPRIDRDSLPTDLLRPPSQETSPVSTPTPDAAAAADSTPVATTPSAPTPPADATAETPTDDGLISIHDFARVQLRVGQVREAEVVRKSKKLLKLQVDVGDETRQIIAGIARKYTPEEMVGRQVVVVTNLRPARLMGELSEGMVLAAGGAEVLALLSPTETVDPGAPIR